MNTRPRFAFGERCRWCRCTYYEPCPQGCGWSDRTRTLCTACDAIEAAWQKLKRAKIPSMHRAFFRGFVVGAHDERARGDGLNPYARGATSDYWRLGHDAGVLAILE